MTSPISPGESHSDRSEPTQAHVPPVTYRIDREGILTAVEGFPGAQAFVGRSLRSVTTPSSVTNLCQQLAQRVRQGVDVSYRFRCDAPGEKRWFLLEARCVENGEIEFKSSLLRAEQRPKIAWLELPARHGPVAPLVGVCSWCGAVRTEDGSRWDPIEVALEKDPRIGPGQTPRLTHGICPICEVGLRKQIQNL